MIQAFEMKNIPLLVDVVRPLWAPHVGDEAFMRFNVEYIIRNNLFENDLRYELNDEQGEFCASAFFARKGDTCAVQNWFESESKAFSSDLLKASEMSRTYLELMDKKTFALMNDDDIKLSLYISRKKGCGSLLLNQILPNFKERGFKNLYLWTDVECNWQWYTEHGYELICEESYEPFSDKDYDYKTFIFKKALT